MAGRITRIKEIQEIENAIAKDVFEFICEDNEEQQITPKGEPKKTREGETKPPIKSIILKEIILENTHIYFFEKHEDNSLGCTEFDINKEISKQILQKYKNNFEKSIIPYNYTIVPFDLGGSLSGGAHKMMVLDEGEVYNLSDIKQMIADCNNSSSDIEYKKLDFYVIVVDYNGTKLYIFENFEQSMRLDKSRLLKAITSRNQKKFNKVSNNEHFYLKFDMTCFLFGGKLYILRKPTFEKIFDYEKKYKEACTKPENINYVDSLGIMNNIELFKQNLDTDNLNILRKFTYLMDFQEEIKTLVSDMNKVRKLITDYKVKGIVIENNKILVEKSNFQSILKLLDRAQTEHPITKEKFESEHKTRIR